MTDRYAKRAALHAAITKAQDVLFRAPARVEFYGDAYSADRLALHDALGRVSATSTYAARFAERDVLTDDDVAQAAALAKQAATFAETYELR